MKQVDFRSKQFYEILNVINSVMTKFNLDPITEEQGKISKSKFNVGAHGTTTIWRITNSDYPELLNSDLMLEIKKVLVEQFPGYIQNKVITIGNPKYTKGAGGKAMSSIVILVAELSDNLISRSDLTEDLPKCLEVESRMYRRDNDLRKPLTRLEDLSYSLIYEPALVAADLHRISGLRLKHSTDYITMEPDTETDFIGYVDNVLCDLDGKSTKATITYENTETGRLEFAEYFRDRFESGSLGGSHNARYILFVIKSTGDVICVDLNDYTNNWLAGNIQKNN